MTYSDKLELIALAKNEMKPYVDYFRENCKIPIINNKTNEISNKVPN